MTYKEEMIERAKDLLEEYCSRYLDRNKNNSRKYSCPICNSGNGKNGTTAFSLDSRKGNTKWTCFSCGNNGDIFDLVALTHNIEPNTKECFEKTYQLLGINSSDPYIPPVKKAIVKEEQQEEVDYTAFFLSVNKNIDKCDYLDRRGISKDIQNAYKIGYMEDWQSPKSLREGKKPPKSKRLIIPTSKSSYTARAIEDIEPRYQKEGSTHLFNIRALHEEKPCFVVEGEIDCLSFLELGYNAVALGSTNNVNKLINYIDSNGIKSTLVIAMDNEPQGDKARELLKEELEKREVKFILPVNIYDKYKDANEILVADRELFKQNISEILESNAPVKENKPIESAKDKLADLDRHIKSNSYTPIASTGFAELDKVLNGGLTPSLYVIGAISSLGKTTFALHMADNIAKQKKDVIIFSLEMSEYELMAKSISRLTYENSNKKTAKTTSDILDGIKYSTYSEKEIEVINKAKNEYSTYADNLYFYEGNISSTSVEAITQKVKDHISYTGNTPVVIIDYLQIVKPQNDSFSDKRAVDYNISMLKNLCRECNTAVICISSFNRDSYNNEVTMSAFKESGSIEYSSDVILALQPQGMVYAKDKNEIKKNVETVDNCKNSEERNIEVKILKNRNGKTNGKILYKYYSMFNYFEEQKDKEEIPQITRRPNVIY